MLTEQLTSIGPLNCKMLIFRTGHLSAFNQYSFYVIHSIYENFHITVLYNTAFNFAHFDKLTASILHIYKGYDKSCFVCTSWWGENANLGCISLGCSGGLFQIHYDGENTPRLLSETQPCTKKGFRAEETQSLVQCICHDRFVPLHCCQEAYR